MNSYQINQSINEIMQTIYTVFMTVIIVIALSVVLFIIVKHYLDFFTNLRRLGLKTGIEIKGIPIARHGLRSVYIPFKSEGHMAVISTTGGGKTHKLLTHVIDAWIGDKILDSDESKNAGYYIDISGDIVSCIDQEDPSVKIFEPLNAESRIVYDPFGEISTLPSRILQLDALSALSYLLIPAEATQDAAVYYERTGRDFLQAILITFFLKGFSFL